MSPPAPDSPAVGAAYDAETPRLVAAGARLVCFTGIGMTIAFAPLDRQLYAAEAGRLGALRVAIVLVLVGILWVLRLPFGRRRPEVLALVACVAGGTTSLAMTIFGGGYASSHNAGLNLTVLLGALLVPWSPVWMASGCLVLGGVALLRPLVLPLAGFEDLFAGQLIEFGITSVIAVLGSTVRERLRRHEFAARFAADEAYRIVSAQAETVRRQQEEQKTILDAVPAMIWFKDTENRILRANRAAAESVGMPAEMLEGRSTYELYPEEAASYHTDDLEVIHSGRPKLGIVEQLATASGEKHWVRTDKIPYYAADGRIVGVVVFAVDITLQKLAERASAEETEIFAGLARVGQVLISSLDTPVLLERLCQVTAEVLGCDAADTLLWMPTEDVFVPVANYGNTPVERELARTVQVPRELMSPVLAAFRTEDVAEVDPAKVAGVLGALSQPPRGLGRQLCIALRRDRDVVGLQVARVRADDVVFTSKQRRLARGIAQIASVALANARLVEQLERVSRLKSEFVSTVSHELRTPLNVILGYAEMARDPGFDADERTALLGRIEDAGAQLLELIESTLEIGRLEAGREDIRIEPVALRAFWRALGDGCTTIPHRPEVRLEWGAEIPDVTLETDPRKLTVVLRNLVGNALKFTEQGWVRVEVAVAGDGIRFTVQDTGIGIRPEDQGTIFEMFRQADGSDSRRFGGTGLGLYIVRRFVQQLGGTVMLESAPGTGSRFTVALPLASTSTQTRRAA